MPELNPTRASPRFLLWLTVAALAAYAFFLWRHAYVVPGGADSSGYFNVAKLFLQGSIKGPIRTAPGLPFADLPVFSYVPLGFIPDTSHTHLVPTYPIGLPVILMACFRVFGTGTGATLALVAHALTGIVLVYLLARRLGAGRPAALVGAGALALSPLYLLYSLQAMSDVPALVWVTFAIWLALVSRERTLWSVGAGFAFGLAVLIRPSNALAVFPVLLALGWSWRRWVLFGLGGLPCAAALAGFNLTAYGKAFASGYGDVTNVLALEWVKPTLLHYARWLPVVGTPFALLALGFPWLVRTAGNVALLLVVWLLAFFGFYAFYSFTHETWWYLRFVLPGLPALIILAALVLERILAGLRSDRRRLALCAAVLLVATAGNSFWIKKWSITSSGRGEMVYADVSHWAQANLPGGSVILTMQLSGALRYYTDFSLMRWDTLDQNWPRIQAALVAQRLPVYATLFDFEEEPALKTGIPGPWEKIAQVRQASIWRLRFAEP